MVAVATTPLQEQDGKLTLEGIRALQGGLPVKSLPVDLNIKKFKQHLGQFPLTKSKRNQLIREYKEKGWSEYASIVDYKGSFPSHSADVVKKTNEDEDGK